MSTDLAAPQVLVPPLPSPGLCPPPRRRVGAVARQRLADLPQVRRLGPEVVHDVRVVTSVLPFKVNDYVVDELVDWDRAPDDPMFRLTFPHRDMLPPTVYDEVSKLVLAGAPAREIRAAAAVWWGRLNPDPGRQFERNVPVLDGVRLVGLQHKYRETVLVFPAHGQTCHAHCAYCFRWPQFMGVTGLHHGIGDPATVVRYLQAHPEVTDVLFTGGDPMVMSTDLLRRFVEPLLDPTLGHVRNIRIGTKALAFWPYRFVDDADAADLLRLFERVVASGRSLDVMAHLTHPRELATDAARDAVRLVRSTGAVLRAQSPVVRHVNDDATSWADLWREEARLGISPYYLFVARDTGAHDYFALPLDQVTALYRDAIARVSGLARTARGPVMSATPGKVVVDGTATVGGARVFVLRFLQAVDADRVGRPFFARWSPDATWYADLRPALGSPADWFDA